MPFCWLWRGVEHISDESQEGLGLKGFPDATVIRGFRADHVIVAAPQYVAKHLIRDYRDQPHVRDFEYGAWAVANLHLKDRPTEVGFPGAWGEGSTLPRRRPPRWGSGADGRIRTGDLSLTRRLLCH